MGEGREGRGKGREQRERGGEKKERESEPASSFILIPTLCTSSVLSTCLRDDVLASCLLTKHIPDDVIVTHAAPSSMILND